MKSEEIDMQHLVDVLVDMVRKEGVDQAFNFQSYHNLTKQQAIQGVDLAGQLPLVQKLSQVCPSLMFKYSDLKQAFANLMLKFPGLKHSWPAEQHAALPGQYSESIMTIMTHCRRLLTETRFKEATKNLHGYHIAKLKELRDIAQQQDEIPSLPVKADPKEKCSTPQKTKHEEKPAGLAAILDMELPKTHNSPAAASLESAEAASPVPPRKQTLKKTMARPAACKAKTKPAKATKVQTTKKKPASGTVEYKLMPYKATGAVAIRIKNGKQVLQIKKQGSGLAGNRALAQKLLDALEAGKPLAEVLEMKDKFLQG